MQFEYQLTQNQRQAMSQNQIASLQLLALTNAELRDFLKQEYMENPLLEYSASGGPPDASTVTYTHSFYDYIEEKALAEIPSPETRGIRELIADQMPVSWTMEERNIVHYFLDELDERGFCRTDAVLAGKELKRIYGNCPSYDTARVQQVLDFLRNCDPPGIFAFDLRECLKIQLRRLEKENTAAYAIVDRLMEELLDGKISTISRALHISTLEVRSSIELIASLDPMPLRGFSAKETNYIEPDILLSRKDGCWNAALCDDWIEDYHICDVYVRLMRRTTDPELTEYFQMKLARARTVLNNIRQRRQTIIRVAETLAKMQDDYLEGKGPLHPLTMSELAQSLQIHPSTVSRALKDKYIQCPQGVISAKALFSGGMKAASGADAVSTEDIKEKIRQITMEENRSQPFSDAAIAELLSATGIRISRRAVAKYRTELGIKSSLKRKD